MQKGSVYLNKKGKPTTKDQQSYDSFDNFVDDIDIEFDNDLSEAFKFTSKEGKDVDLSEVFKFTSKKGKDK